MSTSAVAKGLWGWDCSEAAGSLPRRGEDSAERAAQNRRRTWRSYFLGSPILQVRPYGDRGGDPAASPALLAPAAGWNHQDCGPGRLPRALPAGPDSPQTASLTLPAGAERSEEHRAGGVPSAQDRVSGRPPAAAPGGSGRQGLPSWLLSPPGLLPDFLHSPSLCPRGQPGGSRVYTGKEASGRSLSSY